MAGRRVLITGVASQMGAALAGRLVEHPDFDHVAGLDARRPARPIPDLELVEADLRDPAVNRLIAATRPDTVVHNQIVRQASAAMSGRTMHDLNVIGSLQLLTACEQAATIATIVIRGSAGVYGAEPAAPQFFDEEMSRLYPLRTRFQRDVGEIEDYFATYARRRPEVTCTMLRYQPEIGPRRDTQTSRYLAAPVVPTYLGFDPRIQLVHEDDAVDALIAAVERPVRGAVNVAGAGSIGLTRLIRSARRLTLPFPSPLFGAGVDAMRRIGVPALSEDFRRLLRWGRCVDTTRLTEEVGFTPRHSTASAVQDYTRRRAGAA